MNRIKTLSLAVAAALGLAAAPAMAVVPTEATDAMTAVATDGASMIAAGWPVLAGIVGGLVLMKIFKKVVGRAT